MKYIFGLILLSSLSSILISCDCSFQISGIILNADTKTPINYVAIGKTDTTKLDNPFNKKKYSNFNGQFEFSGIGGGCKEVTVYFSKPGYKTLKKIILNNSRDTVYLKKNPPINDRVLKTDLQTIEMEYFGWGCPCPQWITSKNKIKYLEKIKSDSNFIDLFYNIEPKSDKVISPFELVENMENLHFKFTGRFFEKKQYTYEEGEQEPSITFQYDNVELTTRTEL